jgi:hypothetical protein
MPLEAVFPGFFLYGALSGVSIAMHKFSFFIWLSSHKGNQLGTSAPP